MILKTESTHKHLIDFYEENNKLHIDITLLPSLTGKIFYKDKDYIFKRTEDSDEFPFEDEIYPMLLLIKKYNLYKNKKIDFLIEKIGKKINYKHSLDGRWMKKEFAEYARKNRLNNYLYILKYNELDKWIIDDINNKIEKIKTTYRVKNIIDKYKKYLELNNEFK